jgi:hypothetical protein
MASGRSIDLSVSLHIIYSTGHVLMSFKSLTAHLAAKENRKDKKKHKYGAKKTERPGYSFGSKLEARIFDDLCLRKLAGEIIDIKVQASVYLTDADILYKPDFLCHLQDGSFFYVEAKGFKTPVWAIKRRLWKFYGPGELHVYEGSHTRPILAEVIKPKEKK